jgi:hypothetical protein
MKRNLVLAAFCFVAIVVLSYAVVVAADGPTPDLIHRTDATLSRIIRWQDDAAGVVCWVLNNNAISCLPLAETRLAP